jgi:hypothetical protein
MQRHRRISPPLGRSAAGPLRRRAAPPPGRSADTPHRRRATLPPRLPAELDPRSARALAVPSDSAQHRSAIDFSIRRIHRRDAFGSRAKLHVSGWNSFCPSPDTLAPKAQLRPALFAWYMAVSLV